MSRIALVVRRVGGLEGVAGWIYQLWGVVRRVGGLEDLPDILEFVNIVVRRVGGLEDPGRQ